MNEPSVTLYTLLEMMQKKTSHLTYYVVQKSCNRKRLCKVRIKL